MAEGIRSVWLIVALAMIVPVSAMSQAKSQTLAVNGYAGSVPVTQMNGRTYVEVEALVRLVNGSLNFNGNQVMVTLPSATHEAANATKAGVSSQFLRAAIEEMSTIREWHTALASAIENQYPVTREVLGPYETAATKNLRLAQAAATTDADHHAAGLVSNAYQKMKQLSDNYLAQRAAASYINADALTNDPLNQSLIACGKSLGAMAASGEFTNEWACR